MSNITSWIMFFVGLALLILILLRRWHRYYGPRRKTTTISKPRPVRASRQKTAPLTDAPPDILRWHVEMHEIAREMKAELDSKMGALQVLIRMAREEADRLEELLGPVGRDSSEEVPPVPAEDPADHLPASSQRRSRVYALADEGHSITAIAEITGSPLGEVELILSLRGHRSHQ
jgi:hypothetical protein